MIKSVYPLSLKKSLKNPRNNLGIKHHQYKMKKSRPEYSSFGTGLLFVVSLKVKSSAHTDKSHFIAVPSVDEVHGPIHQSSANT